MVTLSAHDLRRVLDAADQMLEVQDFWAVEQVLLPQLVALLDSDMAVYHHVDLDPDGIEEVDVFWPRTLFGPLMEAYSGVMRQHPFVPAFASSLPSTPMRITEFLSQRQWRATAVYQESHGPLGAHQQMTQVLANRGLRLRAVTVARASPAYTDRERAVLCVLCRHLRAAVRRAYASSVAYAAQRLVPTVGPVLLGRTDHVLHAPAAVGTRAGRPQVCTPREGEVMQLVASGHTNAQVARSLGIAPATVAKHLEHVYAKLGVDNRVAALRAFDAPEARSRSGP